MSFTKFACDLTNFFHDLGMVAMVYTMDEYSKRCIEYLSEKNPGLLQRYLSRGQGLTKDIPEVTPARKSVYQCGSCKGRDVAYMEKQTRSTDEGSTTYFMCNTCGDRWSHR